MPLLFARVEAYWEKTIRGLLTLVHVMIDLWIVLHFLKVLLNYITLTHCRISTLAP